MKNDNDTDRVKKIINDFKNYSLHRMMLHTEDFVAIENVLSEFQGLREFSTETVRNNAELQVELETYKKIVEKLADELRLTVNINKVCGTLDIEKKRCHKEDISCKQCAIDWAKSEVDKDGFDTKQCSI